MITNIALAIFSAFLCALILFFIGVPSAGAACGAAISFFSCLLFATFIDWIKK